MRTLQQKTTIAVVVLAALLAAACASTAQQSRSDVARDAGGLDDAAQLPSGARVNKKGQVVNKKGQVIGSAEEFGLRGEAAGAGTSGSEGGGAGAGAAASGDGSGSGSGDGAREGASGSVEPQGSIKIGVVVEEGNPGRALGVQASQGESQDEYAKAMVSHLNKTGGVAGREVVAVIEEMDVTNSNEDYQAQQAQEICTKFTEDERVFMVVNFTSYMSLYGYPCFAQHRTPIYSTTSSTDDVVLRRYQPWVLPSMWMSYTRMGRLLPLALDQQGFLTKKMGIFGYDIPASKRSAQKSLIPAIEARGGRVIDEVYTSVYYHDAAGKTSSAVLRFKSAGINRVIFWAPYGGLWLLFTREAEAQAYRPRYGVSTYDSIRFVSQNIPKEQLPGTVGAGFFLSWDISDKSQPPPTPKEKQCFQIMKQEAGANFNERGHKFQADGLKYCDVFFLLREALNPVTGRNFGRDQVYDLYTALGSGYESIQFSGASFSRGKTDAISTYAPLAYSTNCECFRYTSKEWKKVPF